jgi:KDO2-lipid IV(A) lauroyltransferase
MLPLPPAVLEALRFDSLLWRRAMTAGITLGPEAFVRYSPPLFGLAFGAALAGKREAVRATLRRVMGPRSPLQEYRDVGEVFSNYASCLTEALLLGSARGFQLRSGTRGVDHYFASAAEGRGVIVVTAHTGGWEIAGPVLSGVHPADVIVVMQRERDERARAIQDAARLRTGVKVVHVGDSPLDALALVRHLRERSVIAMQIDRVPAGMRTRQTAFFGAPWHLPEGPFMLAALSGAPLLPVFTRRLGFMHYEAIVEPPIHVPRRPTPADLDHAAWRVAGAMERFVRAYPTQWFHFV